MKSPIATILSFIPFLVFGQGQFIPSEADLSFPRSLLDIDQISTIRTTLQDSLKQELFQDIYNYAKLDIPIENEVYKDRIQRAGIAREAAFVVLMEQKVEQGVLSALDDSEKDLFINKTLEILNELNPEVGFQSGWSFYYTWQFRSKELSHLLIAYDLLKGAGISDTKLATAKERLQEFAGNLYKRSIAPYPNPIPGFPEIDFYFYNTNNHGVMVSSSLGLAGIILGNCESTDPNYQPINWIQAGMWNLDNLLWRMDGLLPRVADPETISGYAEGPNYFDYGFQNAMPFIRAMWNYLPDETLEYTFNGESRSIKNPWYDKNYHNLYQWMTLIRMPDGRSPVIHDSAESFTTNLQALSGIKAYNIAGAPNSNIWNRSQYLATNVEQGTYEEALFQALPEAGSLVFRSAYNDPKGIYMHQIGKNGIPLYGAKAHHQGDAMSFQLYYDQHIFAIDEGYFGSNHRDYIKNPSDHNLILVDGKGPKAPTSEWVSNDNEVFIENFFDLDHMDYAILSGGWEGAEIHRKTLFVDHEYFVMWDFVNAPSPKTYQFQMHCSGLEQNSPSSPKGQVSLLADQGQVIISKDENHLLVQTALADGTLNYGLVLDSIYTGTEVIFHNKFQATTAPLEQAQFTSILYPYSNNLPSIQTITASTGTAMQIDRHHQTDLILTQGSNELQSADFTIASNLNQIVSSTAWTSFVSFKQEEWNSIFIEKGDTLFIKNHLNLRLDKKVNLALENHDATQLNGYINAPAILYLDSDISLIAKSGAITEQFFDPIKKQSIIHFADAGYFELIEGEADIVTTNIEPLTINDIFAYPNPSKGYSTISLQSNFQDDVWVKILDSKGNIVHSKSFQLQIGQNYIPIDLAYFPKGLYTISLQGNQLSKLIRISCF